MFDKFNRKIDYLRISVTDKCNLRCAYCMPEGIKKITHEHCLRNEEIVEIVKMAASLGVKKIRITGGEPLVKKGIYQLIKAIKAVEGIEDLAITTNGLLAINNVAKLKECGIDRFNISLDTLDREKYKFITKNNQVLNYIALIEELIANDMRPIKINTVLLKKFNDSEIKDFLKLSQKYDLTIRFIELMPIGELDFDYDKHYLPNEEILNICKQLEFVEEGKNVTYYRVPNTKGKIGLISPISHKFCEKCNRIRLTSDGVLKPCLHSNDEINVRTSNAVEIKEKLIEAIERKPKNHKIEDENFENIKRSMNRIGG